MQEFQVKLVGLMEIRVSRLKVNSIQAALPGTWQWFFAYDDGPGNRIWVGWDPVEVHLQICKLTSN